MSKIRGCKSFSEVLNLEFDRRKNKNKSYSLRSFARDLDISTSRLSEVLRGETGISEKTTDLIGKKLKLSVLDQKLWRDLVLSGSARSLRIRKIAKDRLKENLKVDEIREIKEEQFRVISDWYHSAILELVQTTDFKPSVDWIAKRLGIRTLDVEEAVDRLNKLQLLDIRAGEWIAKPEMMSAFSQIPSKAVRTFHRQILQNGIDSLLGDPMRDREIQSMIVAIPRDKLEHFRMEMKKFLVNFWEQIADEPKDDLYSLSVQLCPVRNRKQPDLKTAEADYRE